jgi:hypothetical protein
MPKYGSRNSSVGIANRLRAVRTRSRVRFLAELRDFSLLYNDNRVSEAHPDSYTMPTEGCFLGDKATRSRSWPLKFI